MRSKVLDSSGDSSRLFSEKRFWQSWGLSVLIHSIALILLLGLYWSAGQARFEPSRRAEIVLAIVNAEQQTEYLAESDEVQQSLTAPEQELAQLSPSLTPSDASGVIEVNTRSAGEASDWPAPTQLDASSPGSPPSVTEMLNATDVVRGGWSRGGELSAEDQQRLAEEQARIAALQPVGQPVGLSVFGSETMLGRKFVFVLDQSQSMGSGGLGVLAASKSELAREINKLLDYHQFQIVAYNDRTRVIGRRELLPASEQNKAKVEQFVESLVAAGGTDHAGGLMMGLGMQPDVLVLLSDGGDPVLDENKLALIERLNQKQVQIHCLQFGIDAHPPKENFMPRLAERNAGTYRYINVSQWESNQR